ncbi:LysM domain protein [Metarhizium robertsii]|uniref:LysM domain protein n=2 Tax=Metarhizium robertsii TaxID=568076 RepID=E9EKL1_METRA|nr:LysM domain protein [Metarhizium robertsii ARSEF 23]EFZ03085.1 LysM domain protein [Metarhizium robertsii ARSEF 23]EXV01256.1 LysM domain protein [Metarhizium robertsii]
MHLKSLFVKACLPWLLCASELRPRGVVCSFSTPASNGDTCDSFCKSWGLDMAKLKSLNPGIQCPDLVVGQNYCVIGSVSTEPDTTTQSSTSGRTTTTKSTSTLTTSSSQNSPTQPGLAPNCDKFYRVSEGDQCDSIEAKFGLSSAQFYAWNPSVNTQCTNLWLGYYYCVGVPGAVTTPPTPTPTKPANGIETPQPTQPNMVSYCSRFKWVNSGDTCANIAAQNDISLADFMKWNPDVGNNCQGLWANAYACVGVVGFTLSTYYYIDCTGDVHNTQSVQMHEDGACINTDCRVGSVKAIPQGICPDGQIQISYWEQPGCTGKWFGYGYTSRDTCRKMWTEGWKFKSLHVRCASEKDDCVSKGTCTFDPEPANNVC